MAKKKSSFYHIRKKICCATVAAEVLGVTVEDIEQFDNEGAPVMAERLLLLWDRKEVGLSGWEGFFFSRGVLRYKNRRWLPGLMLKAYEMSDRVNALECEIERLRSWRGLSTVFVDKVVCKAGASFKRRGL